MLRRLMDILRCPSCKESLRLSIRRQEISERSERPFPGCIAFCDYRSLELNSSNRELAHTFCAECYRNEVLDGDLTCSSGHQFRILRSIPRFNPEGVKQERTKVTFDVEWSAFHYRDKIYGHSQEEEIHDFYRRMSIDDSFFQGRTILDAGCGTGRLTQSIGRHAREVVGMDFSEGAEDAWRRNKAMTNVHILQGDILHPPFQKDSFDYVYAKGVLHYVSDVKASLNSLASLVKQEGYLSVTINPAMSSGFEVFNRMVRKVTRKLPVHGVYLLSHALAPFLGLAWRWSGIKKRTIEWNDRAHMIFNWLSSQYQNTAGDRQMSKWLMDLGFGRFRFSEIPVGITGRKSAHS